MTEPQEALVLAESLMRDGSDALGDKPIETLIETIGILFGSVREAEAETRRLIDEITSVQLTLELLERRTLADIPTSVLLSELRRRTE